VLDGEDFEMSLELVEEPGTGEVREGFLIFCIGREASYFRIIIIQL
jgi:hypothetical protein